MAFFRLLLCLIIASATSATARAQIVLPSDVGVTMTASPSTNLQTGQTIDMTLTVTNFGPNDIPILDIGSSTYSDEMYLVSVNANECYLLVYNADFSDGTADHLIDWSVAGPPGLRPPMPAGITFTCHFQIALTPNAPSAYSFSFGLVSSFETDPDPTNDRATVTLQRAPAVAPIPLPAVSTAMLVLLATLSAGIAALALRRPRRSPTLRE